MNRDIYGTLDAPTRKTIPWWLAGLCFLAGMLVIMGIVILFVSAKTNSQYVPTPGYSDLTPSHPSNPACYDSEHGWYNPISGCK